MRGAENPGTLASEGRQQAGGWGFKPPTTPTAIKYIATPGCLPFKQLSISCATILLSATFAYHRPLGINTQQPCPDAARARLLARSL